MARKCVRIAALKVGNPCLELAQLVAGPAELRESDVQLLLQLVLFLTIKSTFRNHCNQSFTMYKHM